MSETIQQCKNCEKSLTKEELIDIIVGDEPCGEHLYDVFECSQCHFQSHLIVPTAPQFIKNCSN